MARTNLCRKNRATGAHLYEYRRISKYQTGWVCAAGCGHFLPKNAEDIILVRDTICWECKVTFKMDEDEVALCIKTDGMPRCFDCRHPEYNVRTPNDWAQLTELNALTSKQLKERMEADAIESEYIPSEDELQAQLIEQQAQQAQLEEQARLSEEAAKRKAEIAAQREAERIAKEQAKAESAEEEKQRKAKQKLMKELYG